MHVARLLILLCLQRADVCAGGRKRLFYSAQHRLAGHRAARHSIHREALLVHNLLGQLLQGIGADSLRLAVTGHLDGLNRVVPDCDRDGNCAAKARRLAGVCAGCEAQRALRHARRSQRRAQKHDQKHGQTLFHIVSSFRETIR